MCFGPGLRPGPRRQARWVGRGLRRSRVGPEDRFCEAVRNDLRVPLTLEGPTRTMRGVPPRCLRLSPGDWRTRCETIGPASSRSADPHGALRRVRAAAGCGASARRAAARDGALSRWRKRHCWRQCAPSSRAGRGWSPSSRDVLRRAAPRGQPDSAGSSRADHAPLRSSRALRHGSRWPHVQRRPRREATHDHLPAGLDQSAPDGAPGRPADGETRSS